MLFFPLLTVQKHGLKVYLRDPHAFTPMLEEGVRGRPPRSLLLGGNLAKNQKGIGKFSEKDAKVYTKWSFLIYHAYFHVVLCCNSTTTMICILIIDSESYAECLDIINVFCQKAYPEYVAHLEKLACAIHPLLDAPPVDIPGVIEGSLRKRIAAMKTLKPLVKSGKPPEFY